MLDDQELIDEFVEEAADHLARIEQRLTSLADGGPGSPEAVNEVFRGMHSIKGAAGLLELPDVRTLSHLAETVLAAVREGERPLDAAVIAALLGARDRLCEMVEDLTHEGEVDASAERAALEALLGSTSAEPVIPSPQPEDPAGDPDPPADLESGPRETTAPARPHGGSPASASAPRSDAVPTESVRVPLWVLDRLMALAGELVLVRNRTRQNFEERVQRDRNLATGSDRRLLQQLDLVTADLQEAVLQTRMQPIGKVFAKIPKLCRDLAGKLGKEIHPTSIGNDVEVDKTILECLSDPLLHLIRNACDHGLEPATERVAAGKPPQGRLSVEAKHDAGQISITIADDGRGVNVERVAAKAVAAGIRRPDEIAAMSEKQLCGLIFAPGFSTAEAVTDVSGRGVGMDVVRTSIEGIGGTVEVASKAGQGTTFTLRVPLTLAIVSSLIVRHDRQTFAIPQVNLEEVVRLHGDEGNPPVEFINDQPVVRVRKKLLPIVHLSDTLAHTGSIPSHVLVERARNPPGEAEVLTVAVVRMAELRFGIVVDEAVGSEEIVVKPNHPSLGEQRCFVGSTILGDGRVALILDVNGVCEHAMLSTRFFEGESQPQDAVGVLERAQELLFTVDGEDRYLVSLSLVSRVIPVARSAIKHVGGVSTVQVPEEGTVRVIRLDDHLGGNGYLADLEEYLLILPRHLSRPVGYLASKIIDVVALESELDAEMHRGEFVLGSTMIGGQVARVLDLFALARVEEPEWFKEVKVSAKTDRVLLAEDTAFFRKAISSYLEEMGFEVDVANDGQEALEILLQDNDSYRVLVSDLEMPRVDGFELISRLRAPGQRPELRRLPALALSALSSPEDQLRALESGFDRYEIKLNRGSLEIAMAELSKRTDVEAA